MTMRVKILVFGLILLYLSGYSQEKSKNLFGSYKAGVGDMVITELILKEDSTFELTTPDPIFPYTHQKYTTTGNWTIEGQSVILNKDLKTRAIKVEINEHQIDSLDCILVHINYVLDEYENEKPVSSGPFEFEMLTLKLNKNKWGYNIRRWESHRTCFFVSKVKNQVLLDSSGTVRIPRKDLESISIYTYGFDQPKVFAIKDRRTNYLEINITHSVDRERMPRNREVIIKGDKAFYYERGGKVVTSGMISVLKKQK